MSELTPGEFKKEFPPGTRIEYQGCEYIALKWADDDDEDNPHFYGLLLENSEAFYLNEYRDGQFEKDDNPEFRIPALTKYPPQVFVLADSRGGKDIPHLEVYTDLRALKEKESIDGDSLMEAISEPGTSIAIEEGLTITFAPIEGPE